MNTASLRFMRRLNRRLERRQTSLPELEPRPLDLQVLEAADFVTGGEANFARAADARGGVLATWRAGAGETHADFIVRAKHGAKAIDAARLVVGGVPDLSSNSTVAECGLSSSIRTPSRMAVAMPDGALHAGQIEALRVIQDNRFVALRAGRRFGKSSLAASLATDVALLGGMAGLFAPIYKLASPLFDVLAAALAPVVASSNRSFGELRVIGGGGVDVWSLERPRAGRGRRYALAVLDEAAFGEPDLSTAWAASIRPTLADTRGAAIVASTPSGVAEDNFFWRICNEQSYGFVEYVAATIKNPFIPRDEIEALRQQHNALVFAQEFEAQFVNLAGVGLFDVAAMLNHGEPWPTPTTFDIVYAALDSGVRGGQEHDASAVVYVGLNATFAPLGLYVLGWEAVEVGAGDIELWFVGVGRTLNEYAKHTRMGSRGVLIERAGLGEMLLAKAAKLGVMADEIQPEHVSRGKDLRAIAVEGLINGGRVRLTAPACEKTSKLKGVSRNHLLYQLASFRVADKDAWKRSDDLVDALVYAVLKAYRDD
jgi:hypothetical protein